MRGFHRSGRYICPSCSHTRQPANRREETLRVTVDDRGAVAYCHHCLGSWADNHTEAPRMSEHRRAEPVTFTTSDKLSDHQALTPEGLAYLTARGISEKTAAFYGIISGERWFREQRGERAGEREAIGFPYRSGGSHYATKWRSLEGKMFSADGQPQTLWGPAAARIEETLILCEGEVDAMSVYQSSGHPARSIPSGASDRVTSSAPISWMDKSYDEISAAKKVVLSFDGDAPGKAYAEEVARRLGRQKVWRVRLPEGRKDINEVLVQDGEMAVFDMIERAEPWPIEGLSGASDYRNNVVRMHKQGMPAGRSTGWKSIDELMTMEPGMLYIGTGKPGGGKSTWIDNMMVNMSQRCGWRFAIASFETPPELSLARLMSVRNGKKFADLYPHQVEDGLAWAENHFFFLTSEGMITADSVIERAQAAVTRWGVNCVIVDPVNFIDLGGEGGTDSINLLLSSLKKFALSAGVAVILVAHPAKPPNGSNGDDFIPTGYSISGCHDAQTEVLTRRGWVPHPDVTLDDVVACFDMETSALRWERPSVVHCYYHSGPMHRYRGYSMNMLVTPNHRMVVKNYWAAKGKPVNRAAMEAQPWRFVNSEDIPRTPHLIPLATLCHGGGSEMSTVPIGGVEYDADDFLRALGWYVAEGYITMRSPAWCQAIGDTQEKMSSTLRRLGLPITEKLHEPTGKGIKVMWTARVRRTEAPDLADWFVENCGEGAPSKKLPDWVFGLAARQQWVLLEAMLEGDGSLRKNGYAYHSTSKTLCDQVQILSIMLGMSASIASYGRAKPHHLDRYVVNICKPERTSRILNTHHEKNTNRSVEHYDGHVFCLTVPTGAYITRRNGAMAITGNSAHYYNRADFGFTVMRTPAADALMGDSLFVVWKAKWRHLGKEGRAYMMFDPEAERFSEPDMLAAMGGFP